MPFCGTCNGRRVAAPFCICVDWRFHRGLDREEADVVVASIYVNPTQVWHAWQDECIHAVGDCSSSGSQHSGCLQFAKNEDFDRYPRQREKDREMLHAAGCHAIFEPASLYTSRVPADLWTDRCQPASCCRKGFACRARAESSLH